MKKSVDKLIKTLECRAEKHKSNRKKYLEDIISLQVRKLESFIVQMNTQ